MVALLKSTGRSVVCSSELSMVPDLKVLPEAARKKRLGGKARGGLPGPDDPSRSRTSCLARLHPGVTA